MTNTNNNNNLSACCPLLDTNNVMHTQKYLFGLLGMLQKTVICHKTPSVILWASILQNESYSLLMGHKAYVCRNGSKFHTVYSSVKKIPN